jgi:renalase
LANQAIAIIGAGIAGLSCAQQLIASGNQITIFEKSKGLAGRCATRKMQEMQFDHGAQFFTAKSSVFQQFVQTGIDQRFIALWQPKLLNGQGSYQWYVGVPGMSSLGKIFAIDACVKKNSEVKKISMIGNQWQIAYLHQDHLEYAVFDQVILAIPAQQAHHLIQDALINEPELFPRLELLKETLSNIYMYPCWTLMLQTNSSFYQQWPYDVYQCPENKMVNEAIAWLARDSSKPGRVQSTKYDQWVIQATPNWSTTFLEEEGKSIESRLLSAVEELFSIQIQHAIEHSQTHRWRYARVENSQTQENYFYDSDLSLGLCGDYWTKSRVEAAFLSGYDLAARIKNDD